MAAKTKRRPGFDSPAPDPATIAGMAEKRVHRMQCAASSRGCWSFLAWESYTREPDYGLLHLNGWREDCGRWVCGHHPLRGGPPPAECEFCRPVTASMLVPFPRDL